MGVSVLLNHQCNIFALKQQEPISDHTYFC